MRRIRIAIVVQACVLVALGVFLIGIGLRTTPSEKVATLEDGKDWARRGTDTLGSARRSDGARHSDRVGLADRRRTADPAAGRNDRRRGDPTGSPAPRGRDAGDRARSRGGWPLAEGGAAGGRGGTHGVAGRYTAVGRRPVIVRRDDPRVDGAGRPIAGGPGATGGVAQGAVERTEGIPPDVVYRPDVVVVRLAEGTSEAEASRAMEGVGRLSRRLSRAVPLYEIALDPGVEVAAAVASLEGEEVLAYAEPDYEVSIAAVPNDPDYGELWGMHNTGQTGGTDDADIDAPEAWEIATGSSDIVVAVIDTGVDYTHPDLAANMWINAGEIAGDGIDNDGNGYVDDIHGINAINGSGDPLDDHFHGTHCAGTVGAVGNNGIGVAGVCWDVRIMACKFLSSSGSGSTSDAITCIEYAVAHGADVMSNSWGGGGYSQAMQDTIAAAREAGVLFVAAAGNNDSSGDFYPAAYPGVLNVAATDHHDARAWFSNYGKRINVAAPGVDITSTFPDESYGTISGTSMACPHAAGLAALVLSVHPGLTPDAMEAILRVASDDLGDPAWDEHFGSGRINAHRAVDLVVRNLEGGDFLLPAAITSPESGSLLVGDAQVDIVGTAGGVDFASYVLDYVPLGGTSWTAITQGTVPVENGLLGTLDTGTVLAGRVVLRLTVQDALGKTYRDYAFLVVRAAEISSPWQDNLVINGRDPDGMAVLGSAAGGGFDGYTLEYGLGTDPASWTPFAQSSVPVEGGTLGVLDTTTLVEEGDYTIRVVADFLGGDLVLEDRVIVHMVLHVAEIDDPHPGFVIDGRDPVAVDVVGTADGVDFAGYRLEYGEGLEPSIWTEIVSATDPVVEGVLGSLAPGMLPRGAYTIRLVVDFGSAGELTEAISVSVEDRYRDGWPRNLEFFYASPFPGDAFGASEIAVEDVDGDGFKEIFVATRGGAIYGFRHDGTGLPGWPLWIPDTGIDWGGIGFGDLDGDGTLEIVLAYRRFYYKTVPSVIRAYRSDGTLFHDWEPSLTAGLVDGDVLHVNSHPLIRDLDGDGADEVIVWSYAWDVSAATWSDFRVHALRGDGTEAPGWPFFAAPPVAVQGLKHNNDLEAFCLGDINEDGTPEIFARFLFTSPDPGYSSGTNTYAILLDTGGTPLSGWPRVWDFAVQHPLLCDLFEPDGTKEIAMLTRSTISTGSRRVRAFRADGTEISYAHPSNPFYGDPIESGPQSDPELSPIRFAVADLDNNGQDGPHQDLVGWNWTVAEVDGSATRWYCHLWAVAPDGSFLPGWPIRREFNRTSYAGEDLEFAMHQGHYYQTPPLIADIDSDGRKEILLPLMKEIAVFGDDGQEGASPYAVNGRISHHGAVLTDLDGDGSAELLVLASSEEFIRRNINPPWQFEYTYIRFPELNVFDLDTPLDPDSMDFTTARVDGTFHGDYDRYVPSLVAAVAVSADGLAVSLDGSGSTSPIGPIVSWDWDFGDGTVGSGETATHAYAAPGRYTIGLTVTDGAGGTDEAFVEVFLLAPFTTVPGNSAWVDFDGAAATGGDLAYDFAWDFGDGTTATGSYVEHQYGSVGPFIVTLTVLEGGVPVGSVSASPYVWIHVKTPDFDQNAAINIIDILAMKPVFGTTAGDGVYEEKYDLNSDGTINIIDILAMKPVFGGPFHTRFPIPGW